MSSCVRNSYIRVNEGCISTDCYIKLPDDISELLGELTCKGLEQLKNNIAEIVENDDNRLYFRNDPHHIYRFDKSVLSNGRIYGLEEKACACQWYVQANR